MSKTFDADCFGAAIITGIIVLVLGVLFYILCLNHVTVNHVGVAYNMGNGNLTVQTNAGFYFTSPLVKVVSLDLLPQEVGIPSTAKVINRKFVRLRVEKVLDFVKLQGFSYSLNSSQENIMMGYAFSGKHFDFIEVVQEGGPETFTR
jgi:membrane-anchored glycerophosphoryl diester phosphodiesterase (GDPDase)